ncbi:MAG: beta-propeller domain-containing protein [Planctomycetaceae bacterium]|nr:beta-propeller domain-containing protein [Planctomycetaceae bacterium]
MPTRRSHRSRMQSLPGQSLSSFPVCAIESLEPRQLLSATGTGDQTDGTLRTIEVSDYVASKNQYLSIEEAHLAGSEIHILTTVLDYPFSHTLSASTADEPHPASIRLDVAADLPIRVFRIDAPEQSTAESVDSYATFHRLLAEQDTEQLYARVDPALSEWRESVLNDLLAAAQREYGDQFGQESERPSYGYVEVMPIAEENPDRVIRFLDSAATVVNSFSETNNQITGVDEADIVETDGRYLYSVSGSELIITSAAGENEPAAVVSRTQLASNRHHGMFLHDGRLTIISQESAIQSISRALTYWGVRPQTVRTVVSVMDVSDPTSPTLQQETVIDGYVQTARAVDNNVYVLVSNSAGVPRLPMPWSVFDSESSTSYRTENFHDYAQRLRIEVQSLTPPSVYQRTVVDDTVTLQQTGWLNTATEQIETGYAQLNSIVQFDMRSDESTPVDSVSFRTTRSGTSHVFATADTIYVATTQYPEQEFAGLFFRGSSEAITLIRKVDLSGERMQLAGTGQVEGVLESQFSVDEHNGYLRVATTTSPWSSSRAENHLFVLEDIGDELVVVGSLTGLAPGERIYSARFDGDRAWIVTFRRIDPVFAFDLSDPANPRLVGELKIPGFSEHLQLIDDNHLLAIGREATEEGFQLGLQVSLFDVSTLSDPQLLFQRTLNEDENFWGYSEALHEHHAFHYIADQGLLVVPYHDRHSHSGLMTLRIDLENGIDIVGHISADDSYQVRRSVRIDDHLYGIGNNSIIVAALDAPDTRLHEVTFPTGLREDRHSVLTRFFETLTERISIREYIDNTGERFSQVELGEFTGQIGPPSEQFDFEFVVNNVQTGVEALRERTDRPALRLDELEERLPEGTWEILVRTRNRLLENAQWGDWIPSDVFNVGRDEPVMVSDGRLSELSPVLQWSDIPDLVNSAIVDGTTETQFNPVDHFEVWISDVAAGHMVIYDRDVPDTQLNLDALKPGDYYAWFRGIYEDGTAADWSPRTDFQILGKPLEIAAEIFSTADRLPSFTWEAVTEAVSYEIQIVRPDGTTTVYMADSLADAEHDLTSHLAPGEYTLRVRAMLLSGQTEWAEHTFTIVDRPALNIQGGRIDLIGVDGALRPDAQEAVELWIGNAATKERVFHSTQWTESTIRDFVSQFGLHNQVGEYEAWVRLVGEENSKWSHRHSFEVFHDAISVVTAGDIAGGEQQILSWLPENTVESYEVFIQRHGQPGAYYHRSGLTGSSHELEKPLPDGSYQYWMRGKLPNGLGYTRWTPAIDLNVLQTAAPTLTFGNDVLTWDAPSAAGHHHLWINRVDEVGNLMEARIAHFRELTGLEFRTEFLPDGHYQGWVQSFVDTQSGVRQTIWSDRLDFEVTTIGDFIDQIDDQIDDVVDDVVDLLNGF